MDRRDYMNNFADEIHEGFNARNMSFAVTVYDEEDNEKIVALPARYVVCGTCDGKGKHVNPSIDSHGISAEEWDRDWSYDDRENYFSGMYDVTCYECKGRTTVGEVNRDLVKASMNEEWIEALKAYDNMIEEQYRDAREREAEMRYGY